MSTAWNIFNHALRELTGPGSQRERLYQACTPALRTLKRKEVPQERRDEFDQLLQMLSIGATCSASELKQAVAALSEAQVNKAIATILSINDQLTRYQPRDL